MLIKPIASDTYNYESKMTRQGRNSPRRNRNFVSGRQREAGRTKKEGRWRGGGERKAGEGRWRSGGERKAGKGKCPSGRDSDVKKDRKRTGRIIGGQQRGERSSHISVLVCDARSLG
jgi:hypothetical protein